MLRSLTLFVSLLATQINLSTAFVPPYGQCGGTGWIGETYCAPPYQCYIYEPRYAQCLPTGVAGTYSTYPTTTKPLTSTLTRTFSWPASTAALPTQSCATQRNSYIITRDDPSDFYFVTQLPNGVARLVNTRPAGDYTYRQLATTIATTCTPKRYLSVYELATTSYKPLVWTAEPHTDYWDVGVVGNLSGKLYISTSGASQYGFKWDFLACGPDKVLYLQTGTQVPPGVTCISVHLNIEVFGSP